MSSPSLTPEQEQQQLFKQLSVQFKTPLRDILGESGEAVQNTISTLIQQITQMHGAIKGINKEVERLKKLCNDNKVIHEKKATKAVENK